MLLYHNYIEQAISIMTTFIIAALTADGFIGKDTDHLADWTSKEDKVFFSEKSKKAGVLVLGHNTFKTIGKPLPDRLNIVYAPEGTVIEGVEVTQKEPKELIEDLESRGFTEVAIGGGAQIYTMFIKAGVVDTLYLTVEPVIFGAGINLFNEQIDVRLKLESEKKLNDNTILLEYKVL